MALTKGRTVPVTDWTNVAANSMGESAEINCSANYETLIHIGCGLTAATASANGVKFTIQTNHTASGNEGWSTLTEFTTLVTGATVPKFVVLGGTEAVGSTVIEIGDTGGYFDDDGGRWALIYDNTVANSELVWVVSHLASTSVTILDPTTNAHDTSDYICDTADSKIISVPFAASRARVICDNTVSPSGGQVTYYVATTQVTGV